MADLGGPEILVIIIAVALLFGWKRMPDMARSLGRSVRIFKSEVDQLRTGELPEASAAPTPIPEPTRTPED
ncbi:Sec-independent protein translocase subunit TatA [Terrabacter sp. 2RAF25]|uniref:Sec-independent protein translocase subunit TatA n=1 Tax=Terrabacter sp. 2RAF25 TaxID=3232998 RepID=UPI003F9498AC